MFRLLYVGHKPEETPRGGSPAERHPDEFAVGFANSIDEALAQARACDMMLVSASLPNHTALEIVRAVAAAEPGVRILVKDLAESHEAPLSYIQAGAAGWLL